MAGRALHPLPTLLLLSPVPLLLPELIQPTPPCHRDEDPGVPPWTMDRGLLNPPGWVVVPAPCTHCRCSCHQDAPEQPPGLGTPGCPPCLTAHRPPALPVLPCPGHNQGMGDTILLPQDLICVLIDDGGFLVLSNQEDHWYQVSSACVAALLDVGCHQGAETSELVSRVA